MTSFALRAVLIVILSIGLLFAAMFAVILPSLENAILEQKREMIRELTNSAWNILARHEQDAAAGLISRKQAQEQTIEQLRSLHYGQQMKDYFWVNDMQPRMIVHPYRTDLENKDLSQFCDPDGKKIFVEMVEIVKKSGSGYLQYRWQWKDNADLVVPKLSFVKGFEPWGWIIGTGVYINDVHQEVQTARHRLMIVTLLILLVVFLLLGILLWESIATDRRRLKAEAALQRSEEKYRKLVESSGECLLLQIGHDTLYANQSMLHLLECDWENLALMQFADIFVPTPEEIATGQRFFQKFLQGDPVPAIFETVLKTRSGCNKEVTVSFSRITINNQPGLVAVTTDVSERRQKEAIQEEFLREAQVANRFWEKPVGEIIDTDWQLADGKDTLKNLLSAAILPRILAQENGFAIIRKEDVLNILNEGCKEDSALEKCAWKKAATLSENTPAWQAFEILSQNDFAPLAVLSERRDIKGIITGKELIANLSFSPQLLQKELQTAETADSLARVNRRFFEWATYLVRSGLKPEIVNRMISENTDQIAIQAIRIATIEAGEAPVPFAFVALGSAARKEQTLCTDQDNALIFADVPEEQKIETRDYFLKLSQKVCKILADCGYKECEGGFMASNPAWCASESDWLAIYRKWVSTSEAEDLLHAKIFFDLRTMAGDSNLVERLKAKVAQQLEQIPGFFFLLARNVLLFQPPISFLGNFIADPDVKDREVINIKGVMALITDFARIYSLKNNLSDNNTVARLQNMQGLEILTGESLNEIKQMFDQLMKMRLEHQARAIFIGREADNYLEPNLLTGLERTCLKEILSQIKNYQVRLSYDFTGSMNQQV